MIIYDSIRTVIEGLANIDLRYHTAVAVFAIGMQDETILWVSPGTDVSYLTQTNCTRTYLTEFEIYPNEATGKALAMFAILTGRVMRNTGLDFNA